MRSHTHDRLARVVAGQRHQHEADMVGFRFLRARHRQQEADRGAGAQRRHHRRRVGAGCARSTVAESATPASSGADLRHHLVAQPLGAVAGQRMRHLVADHGGQSRLGRVIGRMPE